MAQKIPLPFVLGPYDNEHDLQTETVLSLRLALSEFECTSFAAEKTRVRDKRSRHFEGALG